MVKNQFKFAIQIKYALNIKKKNYDISHNSWKIFQAL